MNSSKDIVRRDTTKRKRVTRKLSSPILSTTTSENLAKDQSHDLSFERKCRLLEMEVTKLMIRIEASKLEIDTIKTEKRHLENKVKGVMKHLKETIEAQRIPGFRPKLKNRVIQTPIQERNSLLEWKMNVVQKFMEGVFKELL